MKKCWEYVKYPSRVKLPPYTLLVQTEDGWQIQPDKDLFEQDYIDGILPDWETAINYRGLCYSITDHGNLSLLFAFKNGNAREVWSLV